MNGLRAFYYGAALVLAAASAFGSLGSVISSFKVADNWITYADAVSRDGTYVYYITHDRMTPTFYLNYRYPGGGGGRMRFIGAFPADHGDADRSVLGFGYIADVYRPGSGSNPQTITDFNITTGSAVASWAPSGSMQGYAYNPALGIRYVGINNTVCRYDRRGSLLSSFVAPVGISGLAAPREFAGKPGEYIIVTRGEYWYAFTGQGVEVAKVPCPWESSRISTSACGPGYPPAYGSTLWCLVTVKFMGDVYVCQIHLGNATAVAPASVGRIKALYR